MYLCREKSDQVEIGNLYLQNIIPLSNIREDAFAGWKRGDENAFVYPAFPAEEYLFGDCRYFLVPYPSAAGGNGTSDGIRGYRGQLRMTVLGEGLVLLTLAFIPAVVICLNIAFANLIDSNLMDNSFLRFTGGMLVTFLLVAGMIIAGIWYPANEAAQLQPADAFTLRMIKPHGNIELVTYRLVIKPGSVASTRLAAFFLSVMSVMLRRSWKHKNTEMFVTGQRTEGQVVLLGKRTVKI